jgi:hypothetical protein
MRSADGRDPIAGVEWQPIIDVTDASARPWWKHGQDEMYTQRAAGITSRVNESARVYEIDCRRELGQESAGQRTAWVTHDVHEWGKHKKAKQVTDTRPADVKIAEAEAFARRLEAQQKLDELEQRAWAAAMERGQINF